MSLFKKLFKVNKFPVAKHPVKYAFTCGGVDYFQFEDFNNIPALRGLKTLVFYEELRMKCTLDFLKLHTEAIDNILLQKVINVFEVKKLNDQLKQRLDLALETELLYKIASIVFFPKDENIEDYDYAFNAKKVEYWKQHKGSDFFLQQPLQELIPVLKDFEGNFQMYSQMVEQLNQTHLESLLLNLPDEKIRTLSGKPYFSAVVMPHQSRPYEA